MKKGSIWKINFIPFNTLKKPLHKFMEPLKSHWVIVHNDECLIMFDALVIKNLEQMATTYGCKFLLYFEKWNMGIKVARVKMTSSKKLFAI